MRTARLPTVHVSGGGGGFRYLGVRYPVVGSWYIYPLWYLTSRISIPQKRPGIRVTRPPPPGRNLIPTMPKPPQQNYGQTPVKTLLPVTTIAGGKKQRKVKTNNISCPILIKFYTYVYVRFKQFMK